MTYKEEVEELLEFIEMELKDTKKKNAKDMRNDFERGRISAFEVCRNLLKRSAK